MRNFNESQPEIPSPMPPPEQTPHDIPDPGPQASAWRRALRVVRPTTSLPLTAAYRRYNGFRAGSR
jgi:hypothetical protein